MIPWCLPVQSLLDQLSIARWSKIWDTVLPRTPCCLCASCIEPPGLLLVMAGLHKNLALEGPMAKPQQEMRHPAVVRMKMVPTDPQGVALLGLALLE